MNFHDKNHNIFGIVTLVIIWLFMATLNASASEGKQGTIPQPTDNAVYLPIAWNHASAARILPPIADANVNTVIPDDGSYRYDDYNLRGCIMGNGCDDAGPLYENQFAYILEWRFTAISTDTQRIDYNGIVASFDNGQIDELFMNYRGATIATPAYTIDYIVSDNGLLIMRSNLDNRRVIFEDRNMPPNTAIEFCVAGEPKMTDDGNEFEFCYLNPTDPTMPIFVTVDQ